MSQFVPALELRLRYFVAVAQAGSLSSAAARLHVAVSAISRHLTSLEQDMGCQLLMRHPRGMALTMAGERLAGQLRAAELDVENAVLEARAHEGRRAARVRLAATEGFAIGFLPRMLTAFCAATPDAEIDVTISDPSEVSRLVLGGEADIGLKFNIAPEPDLQVLHAAPAPIQAIVSVHHPLAGRTSVTLRQVLKFPLAIGRAGSTARSLLDLSCSAGNLSYRTLASGNSAASLLPLVAARNDLVGLFGALSASSFVAQGLVAVLPISGGHLEQRYLQVLGLPGRTFDGARAALLSAAMAEARAQSASIRAR